MDFLEMTEASLTTRSASIIWTGKNWKHSSSSTRPPQAPSQIPQKGLRKTFLCKEGWDLCTHSNSEKEKRRQSTEDMAAEIITQTMFDYMAKYGYESSYFTTEALVFLSSVDQRETLQKGVPPHSHAKENRTRRYLLPCTSLDDLLLPNLMSFQFQQQNPN